MFSSIQSIPGLIFARSDVKAKIRPGVEASNTLSQQIKMESETGIRYSVFINLPYFNPIQMVIVDHMHNLFSGTAKRMMD